MYITGSLVSRDARFSTYYYGVDRAGKTYTIRARLVRLVDGSYFPCYDVLFGDHFPPSWKDYDVRGVVPRPGKDDDVRDWGGG